MCEHTPCQTVPSCRQVALKHLYYLCTCAHPHVVKTLQTPDCLGAILFALTNKIKRHRGLEQLFLTGESIGNHWGAVATGGGDPQITSEWLWDVSGEDFNT